jgi:hypothetical protein
MKSSEYKASASNCIYTDPNLHYEDALIEAGMESLYDRIEDKLPVLNFLIRF